MFLIDLDHYLDAAGCIAWRERAEISCVVFNLTNYCGNIQCSSRAVKGVRSAAKRTLDRSGGVGKMVHRGARGCSRHGYDCFVSHRPCSVVNDSAADLRAFPHPRRFARKIAFSPWWPTHPTSILSAATHARPDPASSRACRRIRSPLARPTKNGSSTSTIRTG